MNAPSPPLSPVALALAEAMAGVFADRHINESLLPQLATATRVAEPSFSAIQAAWKDPYLFLHAYFGHYAFAKRGRERTELSVMATAALRRSADRDLFMRHAAEATPLPVWEAFCAICEERGRKKNPQLNQNALQGMLELAQETVRVHGVSVPQWIENEIRSTGRAERVFEQIVKLKGVGPKAASVLLRDLAFLFAFEDQLHPMDRLLALPVDRWLRECAKLVLPEASERQLADWLIAGKMAKFTRQAEVSVARFSMGLNWFGQNQVSDKTTFQDAIERHLLR